VISAEDKGHGVQQKDALFLCGFRISGQEEILAGKGEQQKRATNDANKRMNAKLLGNEKFFVFQNVLGGFATTSDKIVANLASLNTFAYNRRPKGARLMSNAAKFIVAVLLFALYLPDQAAAPKQSAKPLVLQQNEGEWRTRRPREGVASPSTEFLLKIGPKTSGSKHLLVLTEEIRPGAIIPMHKHHGEEEILLIQTGRAHVWLGGKEYDAEPGALVYIPAETWVSLKNTGNENISLVAVWNEPGFEEMLRCGSVPRGQSAAPLSRDGVKTCYHHGDAELETVQASADTKP
jgi:mannose-6-phosphate isomerase-like protein (cupin superfamily)